MLAGILLPQVGKIFQPYPLYLMMFLLFMSFLSIRLNSIYDILKTHMGSILWISFLKLLLLPLIVYMLFKVFYPRYALAAMLLSGISTGVVAPFISTLVRANGPFVLVMVVVSSLLVPFTLPAMVKLLLGRSIEISFQSMMQLLCVVIFVPAAAAEGCRRLRPEILDLVLKARYPLSLMAFALINLGIFARHAAFFRQDPLAIVESLVVASLLGALFFVMGMAALWKSSLENQLASAISLANINNVVIIVFASEFFGPLEPTLAAMYMIPFFGLILPMRIYGRLRASPQAAG